MLQAVEKMVLAAVFAVLVFGVVFVGAGMAMDWLVADPSGAGGPPRSPPPGPGTTAGGEGVSWL